MNPLDTFLDRRHWRQTRNGNFVRDLGPFTVFIFRCGNRWAWSMKSNESTPTASVSESKNGAFAGFAAALQALIQPPRAPGRFKTVDPFILDDEELRG
jgi:hypothetical protein